MAQEIKDRITARGFSRAFEEMCNFIAVAKTGDPKETVKGLISLCLIKFPEDKFDNSGDFKGKIESLMGLAVPEYQLDEALHDLERNRAISRPAGTNYKLKDAIFQEIQKKAKASLELEETVKRAWFEEIRNNHPNFPPEQAWIALKGYLSRTFRRHGIQAAALLDPTIDTPAVHEVSLSSILKDAINETLPRELHGVAGRAIPEFFALVGTDEARSNYVVQLADGAFNFYTLEVPADLSKRLQSQLKELTIFLDTNFIFGILDLHYNTQVQVSHDLVRAITENKIPFKLRYHEVTSRELMHTVSYYGDLLKSRAWTKSLSRAASLTRNLSGIEQKFHESNASKTIDVEEFLRPYEHFDQLLDEKNIKIYRPYKNEEHEQKRIDLYHEYKEFLEKNGRGDKTYETIMHDATVLEQARRLRTQAQTTLDAGALIITCDFLLYRFDWESSRRNGHRACVLLPNIFWQILRPFVPSTKDFETSFAETFALPEFRAIGSGGSKACSKMLQILATYKNVPEQTAFKMLSNDLLLDRLKTAENDTQFEAQVEAAFVQENRELLEEKVALERQLQNEKARREKEEKDREKERGHQQERQEDLSRSIATVQEELQKVNLALEDHRAAAELANQRALMAERDATEARARVVQAEQTGKNAFRMTLLACGAIGLLLVIVFEVLVHVLPLSWIKDHPKSLPLQLGIDVMLFCTSVGFFVKKWRPWSWGVGAFAVFWFYWVFCSF